MARRGDVDVIVRADRQIPRYELAALAFEVDNPLDVAGIGKQCGPALPAAAGEDGSHDDGTEAADIDEAVRSALIVNLLTEDNLPYYFRTIERQLGADGAWGVWTRRWTAEWRSVCDPGRATSTPAFSR